MNLILLLLYSHILVNLIAKFGKVSAEECLNSVCENIKIEHAVDLKEYIAKANEAQIALVEQHQKMVTEIVAELMAPTGNRMIEAVPSQPPTLFFTRNSHSCYQGSSGKTFIRFHPEFQRQDYLSLVANEFYHHQVRDLHLSLGYSNKVGPKLIPCLDDQGAISKEKCQQFSNAILQGITRLEKIINLLVSTDSNEAKKYIESLKNVATRFNPSKQFVNDEVLQQIIGSGMSKYESRYTLVGNVPDFPYRFARIQLFKPDFVQPPIGSACTDKIKPQIEKGYSTYRGANTLGKILSMLACIRDEMMSTGAKTIAPQFQNSNNVYHGMNQLQGQVEFASFVASYPQQVIDVIFPEIKKYHRQYFAEKKMAQQKVNQPLEKLSLEQTQDQDYTATSLNKR